MTATEHDRLAKCPSSAELIAELAREFPGFRLVSKRDSRFSLAIDRALKLLTFGAQRAYLTHYHTVIGNTLYTPDTWATTGELDRVVVLRHERIHLRQRRRYGPPLMAFLYLVPFFPLASPKVARGSSGRPTRRRCAPRPSSAASSARARRCSAPVS